MYLDTRDLWTELLELRERDALTTGEESEEIEDLEPLDEEETERLRVLTELFEEIGEEAGHYGETLIPDWEFQRYAEELADDLGVVPDAQWPLTHIDWAAAAEELKVDYSVVEFDGETYYIRL